MVVRNTFGAIAVACPVMKDAAGKDLFRGLAQDLITVAESHAVGTMLESEAA